MQAASIAMELVYVGRSSADLRRSSTSQVSFVFFLLGSFNLGCVIRAVCVGADKIGVWPPRRCRWHNLPVDCGRGDPREFSQEAVVRFLGFDPLSDAAKCRKRHARVRIRAPPGKKSCSCGQKKIFSVAEQSPGRSHGSRNWQLAKVLLFRK